jgi:hypothetical protein
VTLPNFFVIGAPKAGTSSLYEYLRMHPQVYMSPVKEPMFFMPVTGAPKDRRPNGQRVEAFEEYQALFDGVTDESAIGEASASYLQGAGCAASIHEVVPDARLIALLRNPVDRAFSGYSMRVSHGIEDRTFTEAVRAELDPGAETGRARFRYLSPGYYGRHLERYLEVFPETQLAVHLYEDLARHRSRLLADVYTFLCVDPTFEARMTDHNVTKYPVRSQSVARLLRGVPGKSLARRVVPPDLWARARRSARRLNSRVPVLPAELRRELVDLYRDDIARTQDLIGRDLSAWTAQGA